MSKQSLFFTISIMLLHLFPSWGQNINLNSPDGKIFVQLGINNHLSWSVSLDGEKIVESCNISMKMGDKRSLGLSPRLISNKTKHHSTVINPQVPFKDSKILNQYNELTLKFQDDYQVVFRAYNDGIAYRFIDDNKKSQEVTEEEMSITFPKNTSTIIPIEESMYSHNERTYSDKMISELSKGVFCSLPVMFNTGNAKILFSEASLHDYPGMFLESIGSSTMKAIHPLYVLKAVPNEESSPDRNQILAEEANFIAKVSGQRDYPWRAFIISDDDRTFIESNLITKLSGMSKIPDVDWIKPGKVAWDWYNANNIYGVDFESGLNTATYKHYIDFASNNGIEYVILDEGWTKSTTEILDYNPKINLPEIFKYADSKDVGIILWVLWKPLDDNMEEILSLYSSWGAKGIKVDFMQRNDQYMVNSYEKIAKLAADHKLIVDYHGAFKPAGIERVWPNIINYEGVKGNEFNKWSSDITPEHTVTIPFVRMAAGPLDFTPGSMVNTHPINYVPRFTRPMSMGTRCHQVAMYVVYEAPLQMMCESPTIYMREQETVDFITKIPTTWDETNVLEASVGDYVIVARRNGDDWYIGGMTDASARNFTLDLSFLDNGDYIMEVMKDGINAVRHAEDFKKESIVVNKSSLIKVNMVSGGGWVAIISKNQGF